MMFIAENFSEITIAKIFRDDSIAPFDRNPVNSLGCPMSTLANPMNSLANRNSVPSASHQRNSQNQCFRWYVPLSHHFPFAYVEEKRKTRNKRGKRGCWMQSIAPVAGNRKRGGQWDNGTDCPKPSVDNVGKISFTSKRKNFEPNFSLSLVVLFPSRRPITQPGKTLRKLAPRNRVGVFGRPNGRSVIRKRVGPYAVVWEAISYQLVQASLGRCSTSQTASSAIRRARAGFFNSGSSSIDPKKFSNRCEKKISEGG